MATKRRRVWANWYPALGEAPAYWGTRLGTKSDARMAAQPGAEMVSLIERLPGDVVLSREEAARINGVLNALEEAPVERSSTVFVLIKNGVAEIRALLRGRR